jgi:hypothetical protein
MNFFWIAQAFPLMEKLSMINRTPQNRKANNNNEHLPIIVVQRTNVDVPKI